MVDNFVSLDNFSEMILTFSLILEDCLKECKGNEPKVCGTDGNEYDECSIKCYHNHGVTKKCNGTCPCKGN